MYDVGLCIFFQNVPHTIVNEDSTGNLIFTGFIPDLVEAVSNMLGFKYKMVLDQRYGIKESTGEWTGMVGQLLRGVCYMLCSAHGILLRHVMSNDSCRIWFTNKFWNIGQQMRIVTLL